MERPSRTSPAETWDALFSDFYLRAFATEADDADAAQAQALAAVGLTKAPPGGEVLDVPCGFGRHAVPLARAGYRVVGADRSGILLEEARRRTGDGPSPELVQSDYRALPFADESFHAALNLFTSLGYLGDEADTDVLSEIARVLRPGGRLVVEAQHRDSVVREFSEQGWRPLAEGRVLLQQRAFDAAAGVALTTWTLIEPSGARDSRTFSLRVYTATELVAMLERAGFARVSCYGDFAGGPLRTDTRLVAVGQVP